MNSINEVQKINVPKKTGLVITKTLVTQADELAQEHEEFNEKYMVAGRKALYRLLGKIYALAEQLDHDVDKKGQINLLRKTLSEKYAIRTQENTSDTSVLVRYITQADRKTTHVYSRAIEMARINNIDSSKFVEYVEQAGGIERIRSIGVNSDSTESDDGSDEEVLNLAHTFLSARTEIPFATFKAPKAFDTIYSKNCTYEFVICSLVDGQYRVIGKLPADVALENLAVKHFAKYLCKDIEKARQGVATIVAESKKKRAERFSLNQRLKGEDISGDTE